MKQQQELREKYKKIASQKPSGSHDIEPDIIVRLPENRAPLPPSGAPVYNPSPPRDKSDNRYISMQVERDRYMPADVERQVDIAGFFCFKFSSS